MTKWKGCSRQLRAEAGERTGRLRSTVRESSGASSICLLNTDSG